MSELLELENENNDDNNNNNNNNNMKEHVIKQNRFHTNKSLFQV